MENLCRLMIVDDEYTLLQGIKYMFDWEKEGFTIAGDAANGSEALQLVEKVNPHIVITDIVMPLIGGVELTRLIKLKSPKTCVIVLSSYSEFDYVKAAFKYGASDYILKPELDKNSLLSVLNKARSSFKELVPFNIPADFERSKSYVLNQLASGFVNSLDEQTKISLQNRFMSCENYIICCDSPFLTDIRGNAPELIDPVIIPFLAESIKGCDITSVITEDKIYLLLIGSNGLTENSILETICSLKRSLHEITLDDTCFSISRQIDSLQSFPKVYQETRAILGYKFYGGENIFSGGSINLSPEPEFETEDFNKCMDLYELGKAFTFIENYVLKVVKNLSLDPYILKKNLQNTIYNAFRRYETSGAQSDRIRVLKLELFKKLDISNNFRDMLFEIKNIFSLFEGIPVEMKNPQLMEQIHLYVRKNYMNEIYLFDIAKDLHISYSYLSSYFKTNEQKSFSDYLNCIRIEKAKEYIKDPNISISMISELCGYSDQSYFGKVFKKNTGYTPSKLREKYLKGKTSKSGNDFEIL